MVGSFGPNMFIKQRFFPAILPTRPQDKTCAHNGWVFPSDPNIKNQAIRSIRFSNFGVGCSGSCSGA